MKDEKRLKINLEILIVGDGRRFLNFWDYRSGDDVVAELKNGMLYQEEKLISLNEFIDQVKSRF